MDCPGRHCLIVGTLGLPMGLGLECPTLEEMCIRRVLLRGIGQLGTNRLVFTLAIRYQSPFPLDRTNTIEMS